MFAGLKRQERRYFFYIYKVKKYLQRPISANMPAATLSLAPGESLYKLEITRQDQMTTVLVWACKSLYIANQSHTENVT